MSATNSLPGMLRALVADDVPFNRLLLRSMLELAQCQVTEAEDGAAAMRVLTSAEIDIVFLDLRMPQMDGWQVLRQYRSLPLATARIYVVSTDMSDDQKAALLAAGATGVLERPVTPDMIKALVHSC